MKTIKQKLDLYLKDLENVLSNDQYTKQNLEKLTLQSKEALIVSTNICEYLDKTEEKN